MTTFASVPHTLGAASWVSEFEFLTIVGDDVYTWDQAEGTDPDFPEADVVERILLVGDTTNLLEEAVVVAERGFIHDVVEFGSAAGKVILYDQTDAWTVDVVGDDGSTAVTFHAVDEDHPYEHAVASLLDAGQMEEFRQAPFVGPGSSPDV